MKASKYLIYHRTQGGVACLGLSGVIITTGIDAKGVSSALENLNVGEYVHVGSHIVVGVEKGVTLEELKTRK